MRKHWQLILVLVFAVVAACAIAFHIYEDEVRDIGYRIQTTGPLAVDHVADGDSLTVISRLGRKLPVRLLGINTKEVAHGGNLRITEECWGPEARDYVKQIAKGKIVSLYFDPLKSVSEDHDRLLGYVYLYDDLLHYWLGWGAIDLNLHLIETGYAEEWLYQGTYTRAAEFLAAEAKAKAENMGGWKACPDFKKHPRAGTTPRKRKRKSHDE